MQITPSEKRARIGEKKAEIQKLKYDRDLLIDQKRSSKQITMMENRIAIACKELEELQTLSEKERPQSVSIKVSGGIVNQIVAGSNSGDAVQHNRLEDHIDLAHLEKELIRLHKEMKKLAKSPKHDISIGAIVQASQAAKANDRSKVFEHLKTAGKWAFEVATKIGTSLATEALKLALGL